MHSIERCPVCDAADSTPVCEFNRFILRQEVEARDQARYDYALCHGCGLLYATRRPVGSTFTDLLHNFNESLGRAVPDENLLLYPGPLTDAHRAQIREAAEQRRAGGGLADGGWLPAPVEDRMASAPLVELLASVGDLRAARVLEIRPKTGGLLDALRRRFGAEPYAMPIFESQAAAIEGVYGIPTSELIDFEQFDIPFDGEFDVIVSKHMFTHVLDPAAFFATLRSRLRPGGLLLLHAEPNDRHAMDRRKSLFATMNPFHMQAFDPPTLERCLRRFGFEPEYSGKLNDNLLCLARLDPAARFEPIAPAELRDRIDGYERWRLFSILSLPESSREPYKREWRDLERTAVERGEAARDKLGRVTVLKPGKKSKVAA
ncbi:MAG: hypothetical protein QOD69_2514 [Solirubrobacteraceae bacterium]|jgi:SAM-dependent methyltransferase|nr:hypothetical protein [Solirubrobacteraceae bacterium]